MNHVRRRYPLYLLAAAAGVMLVAAALTLQSASAFGTSEIALVPTFSNLFVGGPHRVIEVQTSGNTTSVKGFTLDLTFPPNVVQLGIAEGTFLSSTGRTTACTETRPGPDELIYSCDSTGAPAGATGSGVLATIDVGISPLLVLRATVNNGVLALISYNAAGTKLTGASGQILPINRLSPALVTVRALEGDVNGDCVVNIIDEQMIANRYLQPRGSLLYSVLFDLEPQLGDGDIDIKDLQFVFGRDGSTCDNPLPPQPPVTSPTPTSTPTQPDTSTPDANEARPR